MKKYLWDRDRDPPKIDPHSIAKHRVLQAYLEKYVDVLTVRLQQDRLRLTLVDGFSGGGMFKTDEGELHFGSPFVMLNAMQVAEAKAQASRRKGFQLDAQFLFVETDKLALQFLSDELRRNGYSSRVGRDVHLLEGDFRVHCTRIVDEIRQRGRMSRAIFLLDQYGYKDVPLTLLKAIFSKLLKAEVILTFAADSLVNYVSDTEQSRAICDRLGLSLPIGEIRALKQKDPREWKGIIQRLLHHDIHTQSGAVHYTPFFIQPSASRRAYWLVHLSNHPRARDVMAALHWELHNHFVHYGGAGLEMLGFDASKPFEGQASAMLPFEFDSIAKQNSFDTLLTDLPVRIGERFRDGVTFAEFFAGITNETPATSDLIRDVLQCLVREGDLQLRDEHGRLRQRRTKPSNHDIILPSVQTKFSFPR